MTTIALIGPGAIGGVVAAWLGQRREVDLVVCARTPFTTLKVKTPDGQLSSRPRVVTDVRGLEPVDWVIVATKTYDTAAAETWFEPLVGAHTRVAVLRNGVEHLAPFLGRISTDRLVPAVVDIPAERTAPGRIRQRRNGWIRTPVGSAAEDFVGLFSHSPIQATMVEDFATEAWKKLALNCAGAVNALTLQPAGIAHDEGAASIMRTLVQECVAVGRAEGAQLTDDLADAVVEGYRQGAQDAVNSMHADRLAGRPMELDARNGVIVRLGARHGVPTPANALIVALLRAAAL